MSNMWIHDVEVAPGRTYKIQMTWKNGDTPYAPYTVTVRTVLGGSIFGTFKVLDQSSGDMVGAFPVDEIATIHPLGEETYRLHYVSADAPGTGGGWSVYREEYPTVEHDEPIDGLTVRLHSGLTEEGANAEANALQKREGVADRI